MKGCAWVVDAHIHKNGGTSFRNYVLKNEWKGNCVYSGYEARKAHLEQEYTSWNNQSGVFVREVHRGNSLSDVLDSMHSTNAQRPHVQLPPCKIISIVRIRHPIHMYSSFYKWTCAFKKECPPFEIFASKYPNIQSHLLARPDASFFYEQFRDYDASVTWTHVKTILDRATYVAPTDKLNYLIVLLSRELSLPLFPFAMSSPRKTMRYSSVNFTGFNIEASVDWKAYTYANERFMKNMDGIKEGAVRAYERKLFIYNRRNKRRNILPIEQKCSYRSHIDDVKHQMCPSESQLCRTIQWNRNFDCPWTLRV